jgi:hypothetical protein
MYNYVTGMRSHYLGNHVMIPMGGDFAYSNAMLNFLSTDRLISYFNSHYENVTLIYSTPSEFLDALIG